MLTENELGTWFSSNDVSAEARSAIARVRSSDPARQLAELHEVGVERHRATQDRRALARQGLTFAAAQAAVGDRCRAVRIARRCGPRGAGRRSRARA